MTRLLIASLYYEPDSTGIAPYTTKLAEHLVAQGYDVTAITGMPHYPAWRVLDGYRGRITIREMRNGVRLLRRRQYTPSRQSALQRALYEATFFANGLAALRLPPPDAVLGIVPGIGGGLLARIAAARFGVPYGLILQDLVAPAARQSGIDGGAGVASIVRAAEAWPARGAAAIGIVAEGFRPYVESLGIDPTRIRRVRNWVQTSAATETRETTRERLAWPDDAFICLHAGNMGHKQGIENIIEAARIAAASDDRALFVLMGDGNQRAALEALAGRYALTNVRFLPLQTQEAVANVLAAADVLLLNQRGSVTDMALPSKLTSYFAAGVPVVAAVAASSEAAHEVEWSSGGIVVAPDDPRALLQAVGRVAADVGLAVHLGASGRTYAASTLSEASALRGYEQLVASVLASSGRGRVHMPLRLAARVAGEDDRRAA